MLLNPAEGHGRWDKIIDTFLATLITLNIVAVILETVDNIYNTYTLFFSVFERFSVYVFSVEYVLRLWVCTCETKYKHPITGRLKWIFSFGALIDLLAFLPFYLPLKLDLRVIRILRLFRFLRIFAENQAQPDKYSSIPATMWWCVTTLTTVGYGDVFPVTAIGKILTAFIAILGIGMFALPAGILASGFSGEFQRFKKKEKLICPHCGKEIFLSCSHALGRKYNLGDNLYDCNFGCEDCAM